MSSARFETFLARLYTDEPFRRRFVLDPVAVASGEGLTAEETAQASAIDPEALELAAHSFGHKRAAKAAHDARKPSWWRALLGRR